MIHVYVRLNVHELCFLAICVHVILSLLQQSQYWPHLSFRPSAHKGGLKYY